VKRESQIQAAILRYLKSLGLWCWAVKAAVCNQRGVPDILCCYRGRFVALEVKTGKGRLSGPQRVQIMRIRRASGKAHVVKSVQEAREIFANIDREDDSDAEAI
jgi:RecB family endonuclease NucS